MPIAPPNQTAPAAGANPKLLVRFAHLPDTQLADDESPDAPVRVRSAGPTSPARFARTEGDQCRVLDAAVRTINALHQTLPISFVLTGGDNADNAQRNELEWFMQIMDGAPRVKCDSGDADDPVPGPDNDGKDPVRRRRSRDAVVVGDRQPRRAGAGQLRGQRHAPQDSARRRRTRALGHARLLAAGRARSSTGPSWPTPSARRSCAPS